jgi:hypothetical protein
VAKTPSHVGYCLYSEIGLTTQPAVDDGATNTNFATQFGLGEPVLFVPFGERLPKLAFDRTR